MAKSKTKITNRNWSKYTRKYCKDWEKQEKFKNWLTESTNSCDHADKEAFCKVCKVYLRAHKTDLERHAKTDQHIRNSNCLDPNIQPKLKVDLYRLEPSDDLKTADICLAVHTAAHNSIRSIDHLGEVLKRLGRGSVLENLRLHRTKCSALITKVISPSIMEELVADIGSQPYSIILDESTDVSNDKYMAYCVRYFSYKKEIMVTDFLGFQIVIQATAEQLHINFKEFLNAVKLDLTKLISISTDGASNLCGIHNSLFTRLKEDCPGLLLLKCVCHSLNRCAVKAAEEMPSTIEFLLRESRGWFSHSSVRKSTYEAVYALLNPDEKPPQLCQLSGTRWLAFHKAVQGAIDQWDALKKHFTEMSQSPNKEVNCYVARQLANMYQDNSNLFYMHFLNSVVGDVNKVNLSFQSKDADIAPLYEDLRLLLVSVAGRVFKPASLTPRIRPRASVIEQHEAKIEAIRKAVSNAGKEFGDSKLPLDAVDYGYTFQNFEGTNHGLSRDDLNAVKMRCSAYLVRLCSELLLRLPENFTLIEKLRFFQPAVCLSNDQISVNDLPWELAPANITKSNVESELRKLKNYTMRELFPNENTEFSSNAEFWFKMLQMKTAGKEPMFQNLATFALKALSLPISNAVVERIFSIMSIVKTKIRNRMGLEMLNAILHIRVAMHATTTCCKAYMPTTKMLQRFNAKTMYPIPTKKKDEVEALGSTNDDKDENAEILQAFEDVILLLDDVLETVGVKL